MSEMMVPGQTIGIIGGGHLARLLTLSAKSLGFNVGILDENQQCAAAKIADWHIAAPLNDERALIEMAERSDLVTFEGEQTSVEKISMLEEYISIPQGSELLAITKNKLLEKSFLDTLNINIVPYATIVLPLDMEKAIDEIGFPCLLKTTQYVPGVDNQIFIKTSSEMSQALPLLATGPCILEAVICPGKKISVIVARNQQEHMAIFPFSEVVETEEGIYQSTKTPFVFEVEEMEEEALRIVKHIAQDINLSGVMVIELLITELGTIYVTDLYSRPHISGNYSIDACEFSQYELHIRGLCNWPLPEVTLIQPAYSSAIYGQHLLPIYKEIQYHPSWHFHFYGKLNPKPNRLMGHITVMHSTLEALDEEIEKIDLF